MIFDNFKTINDTQGHLFGDTVLTEMTAGVKRLFRSDDLIGRIGGDEFVVFLKNIPSSDFAQRKAEQVLHLFDTAFAFGKNNFQISCSIGIAMAPAFGTDFTTLYHNADIALYSAKKQGKNRAVLFDDSQMNALEYYMQKPRRPIRKSTLTKMDKIWTAAWLNMRSKCFMTRTIRRRRSIFCLKLSENF